VGSIPAVRALIFEILLELKFSIIVHLIRPFNLNITESSRAALLHEISALVSAKVRVMAT